MDCFGNVVVAKDEVSQDDLLREHPRCSGVLVPPQDKPMDDVNSVGILHASLHRDVTAESVKVHGDSAGKKCIDGRMPVKPEASEASCCEIKFIKKSFSSVFGRQSFGHKEKHHATFRAQSIKKFTV